jgi:hypothetical protein
LRGVRRPFGHDDFQRGPDAPFAKMPALALPSGVPTTICNMQGGLALRIIGDVAVEAGRALARELNTTFIAADLADPTAPRKLFDAAEKSLGIVSILIHSASPRRREIERGLASGPWCRK